MHKNNSGPRNKRNLHAWRTSTDDGRRREVRAQLFGSVWTVESREGEEEDWTRHDPPALEDLIELHDVLFNKYQRKHLAWEHLRSVRTLIDERGGSLEDLPGAHLPVR